MAEKDNVIFVGKKPIMSYVFAIITQFTNGQKEVHIKARGKAISRAVDVVQVLQRRFMQDVKVKDIQIGSELKDRTLQNGKVVKVNVSTIDITVEK
jgi:DNA-binding protein Alba